MPLFPKRDGSKHGSNISPVVPSGTSIAKSRIHKIDSRPFLSVASHVLEIARFNEPFEGKDRHFARSNIGDVSFCLVFMQYFSHEFVLAIPGARLLYLHHGIDAVVHGPSLFWGFARSGKTERWLYAHR
jgi:hypothetical protein